jgi:enoyl-CoA hydratase/carnithine racemase
MSYEEIVVEAKGGVGRIVFNRPKMLNAYNERMSKELIRAVGELTENPEAQVIVITGTGRAFMAGADINMLSKWCDAPRGREEVAEILSQFFSPSLLEQCPKPVIGAVNGLAFGMGCEVTLGCDVRIAGQSAQFGQPEIKLGIMTGAGGSQRLPRLVGSAKAMEMILTGDPINAAEAFRTGLVNQVVPDDQLEEAVAAFVKKLLKKSDSALRLSKEAVIAAHNMGLYEGVAHELRLFSSIFETADAREGVSAFLEKRKPVFNKPSQ